MLVPDNGTYMSRMADCIQTLVLRESAGVVRSSTDQASIGDLSSYGP